MKRVAFVFSSAPHGSAAGSVEIGNFKHAAAGREGLDALLATSALTDDIGVFFVGDGVFQLLPEQRPGAVLARDYIATFKLLSLYDIDQCWLCADSARERGLDPATPWVVDVECLAPDALRARLHEFDVILRF
jgi:tRNA 2-thiouridine synthesizing protein C